MAINQATVGNPPLALAYAGYHRFRPATFAANPYRADAAVRLPLPGVRRRLLALAPRQPAQARAFAAFLRARRPLQAGLAAELARAAAGGDPVSGAARAAP
ncbi:MAG: hypothetical protein IPK64_21940 [bacterium]|nr:hypothetical protein [bacterium]